MVDVADVLAGRASWAIHIGDVLEGLALIPEGVVHCVVTSPPYLGLRSYLPDTVRLRDDLTNDEVAYITAELGKIGIRPIADKV